MSVDHRQDPFEPVLPNQNGDNKRWSRLYGAATALALANAACRHDGPVLALVPDTPSAMRLYDELDFFSNHGADFDVVLFPDWETLPYDDFSPHHDIVSERLSTLYRLPDFHRGVLIVPVATAMTRIAPQSYLLANTFMLAVGDAPVDPAFLVVPRPKAEMTAEGRAFRASANAALSDVLYHGATERRSY